MSKNAQRIKRVDVERQLRLDPTPKVSQSRWVAVVDDDPFFRRSLGRLLGTMGLQVRGFVSAEEFLAYPHKKRFRCLLLDFNLPGMTGSELLAHLGHLRETLPVIVISALDELDSRIADTTAARDEGAASLQRERANVVTDRATIAARVPAELLALYEKQRARYGVGASHLRGGVSSASGVALNATDLGAVRAAAPDDVLLCPDSSAILVRTAESGL